jgi:hypothetical protein
VAVGAFSETIAVLDAALRTVHDPSIGPGIVLLSSRACFPGKQVQIQGLDDPGELSGRPRRFP